MKHILYILPTVGELSQTFIVDEIELVSSSGDISILSMSDYAPSDLSVNWKQISDKYQIDVAVQPSSNIKVSRYSISNLLFKLCRLLVINKSERYYLLWAFKNIKDKYKTVSHIHCHFAGANLSLAYALSILLDVKVSVNFHGYDVREWQIEKDRLAAICNETTANFVVSSSQKQKLEQIGVNSESIVVQPVGVNISVKKHVGANMFEETFRLVSVARLHPIKNHMMALKVLNVLIKKGYSLHYSIIGDGETLPELRAFVQSQSIEKFVTFMGALSHKEAIEAMRQNHVHLLTSIDEGAPTVVMEAMVHEVLNVCTEVGGVADLIEHNKSGKLVKSEVELTIVIEELINDRAQIPSLTKAAYQRACLHFDKQKLVVRKLQFMELK